MALVKTIKDTRAPFRAAIIVLVVALVVSSPCPAQGSDKAWCGPVLEGGECTIAKCRSTCTQRNYVNPLINCWQQPGDAGFTTCCCDEIH
ncbi:hypothetical protein EJB05_09271 [Eragrostis curvula]|uniref:Knottin scorpion toxin-like domain-containing protein n=1 Tax=Eragrostis curvula TaxID=38414 RepID=A0A5J9W3X9_9POAL|nr:hypothetical protein EJB05_09271 [Eragrostis curvula]